MSDASSPCLQIGVRVTDASIHAHALISWGDCQLVLHVPEAFGPSFPGAVDNLHRSVTVCMQHVLAKRGVGVAELDESMFELTPESARSDEESRAAAQKAAALQQAMSSLLDQLEYL